MTRRKVYLILKLSRFSGMLPDLALLLRVLLIRWYKISDNDAQSREEYIKNQISSQSRYTLSSLVKLSETDPSPFERLKNATAELAKAEESGRYVMKKLLSNISGRLTQWRKLSQN